MKKLMMILLALLLAVPVLTETTEPALLMEIHQIDMGFADGYFIRLGDVELLIDGGEAVPENPEGRVMRYLENVGCTGLDAYIVTHWHLDHCYNVNNVLAQFGTADTVVYGPSKAVHADYDPLANGVYAQMVPGDVIEFGGMTLHCVGPQSLENNGVRNQDSLNFVIQYGERRVLFTGDFAASGNINKEFKDICANVDILKFPHHGMKPFEIGKFAIRTTSPEYVIVPGVANKYEIWNHFDNNGAKFPKGNVYTVADSPFVILMDGAELLEIRTKINPADYAP